MKSKVTDQVTKTNNLGIKQSQSGFPSARSGYRTKRQSKVSHSGQWLTEKLNVKKTIGKRY